jgi:hypothetical protein
MRIIKESEYSFTTVTVGYLAITFVDGHEVEVEVEGDYDTDGFPKDKRISEVGSGTPLYGGGLLLADEIQNQDKLFDKLGDLINEF